MGAMDWLSSLGGGAKGLGGFGEWFGIFGSGIQQGSNKLAAYGGILQAITKPGASMSERIDEGVEGVVKLTMLERVTKFLDGFLPSWIARPLGTWLTNMVASFAGDVTHNLVDGMNKPAAPKVIDKSAAPETSKMETIQIPKVDPVKLEDAKTPTTSQPPIAAREPTVDTGLASAPV